MKAKYGTVRVSVFLKIIIMFLVVILPLYALSVKIINTGSDSTKEEISKSAMNNLDFYLTSIEAEVKRARELQWEYTMDKDIELLSSSASVMTDFEKSQSIVGALKNLAVIKNSSVYIENVSAYIPSIDRTLSTRSRISSFSSEEFNALQALPDNVESPLIYWKDRVFLSLSYPLPYSSNKIQPNFVFSIELSKKDLQKTLLRFSENGEGGSVLTNEKQGLYIASDNDQQIQLNIKEFLKSPDVVNRMKGIDTLQIGKRNYMIAFMKSDYLGMTLLVYIPEQRLYGSLKKYQTWFWALSIVSVGIIALFSLSIYRLFYKPIHRLAQSFKKLDDGNLDISIRHSSNDEFFYIYEQFNNMIEKLKSLIHSIYEQQILTQKAELKQLQSQINPHFLYNTFFHIYRMAKVEDYSNLVLFTKHLGNYYQFITRSREDEIPLYKEVEHACNYIGIQNVRYGNRIMLEMDEVPESLRNLYVPRLILQPIIENAYEHGLKDKQKNGIIRVEIKDLTDRLLISVEDNGDNTTDEELFALQKKCSAKEFDGEVTGILNVHRRIQIKFGTDGGISVSRGKLGGLRFELSILLKGGGV